MDILAFVLVGAVTGLGSALMLFRFESGWLKALSLTGGSGILIGEFLAFAELLGVTDANRAIMLVSLLLSWLIVFSALLIILLRSFKRQETKYKIQTWEILLGDKKAIDDYYNSKKVEVGKLVEGEYDFENLRKIKREIDAEKEVLDLEKKRLNSIKEEVDDILDKKHQIDIPESFKFPIRNDFFLLLPRYIKSISEFEHHLSSFTDSFVSDLKEKKDQRSDTQILKTYLSGVSYYIGQYLFDWRDVRVHFRTINKQQNTYDKFVAVYRNGLDYDESITCIPADKGLIALATKSKRSVVFSANRESAFDTGSNHIWKDYITMVFEKLHIDGRPVLSLGVSVKHHVDHKEMLYFLSYIQIEQVIQENLLKLDETLSVCNSVLKEAA
ncbi:TPA: hypothetical protein ACGFXW_003545 [Vibrio cholerae]|uniref:hypothetical protein n=1 Tax=Vibrio cholerae TaxID=666 RepID=UPI0036F8A7C5|nr:hypothetical protein [Vibrio cholerae]EJL6916790.1 hypothetical protein [Vibrio cholerae]